MTVALLPNVFPTSSRTRFERISVLSWHSSGLCCACGSAEPDCLYCSGPESD
jgi:hypothetical protein